ncbi:DUF397 domain-containing protein [Actinokineospora enzanensis]|uniref:DUF397 domain-containing protein n=1 Tax=Actinokineospora enzanensis TaxID=155975 RepID=UPI00037B5117|nr:DUF397 domain-containing protein [Actinokineospora enzanensis]
MTSGRPSTGWFKSSFSLPSNDNCVEVRLTEGEPVSVRDSKNPGPELAIPASAWAKTLRSL